MLREARGRLKATVGNRVTTRLSLYLHRFLFFSVSFNQSLVFLRRLCSKACGHRGPKPGWGLRNIFKFGFHENKPKDNKGKSKHLRFCWQQLFGQLHSITISLKSIRPNKTEIKIIDEKQILYISRTFSLRLTH